MLTFRFVVVLSVAFSTGLPAGAQTTGTTPPIARPQHTAQTSNLRIVSPKVAQKITDTFVEVQYQITNPSAAMSDMPVFQLQLDGGSPLTTSSTEHTFTGLTPGKHVVTVELVDANGTPVWGTRASVHFVVVPSGAGTGPGASVQPSSSQPKGDTVAFNDAIAPNQPDSLDARADAGISDPHVSSNVLPVLSIVGFGVLVGGLVSSLRTR